MNLLVLFLLIVLALIFCLVAIEIHGRCTVAFQATKVYPGPKIYPIIGSALATASFDPIELMSIGRKLFKKYKTTYRGWILGILVLNTVKAKDVEVILSSSKNVNKSFIYKFLNSFIGTGLLTADETALGIKLDEFEEGDTYRNNVHKIGAHFVYRFARPWLYYNFMYKLFGNGSNILKILEETHEFTRYETKKRRFAMLDTLLAVEADSGEINNEGICEEVDTFTFEGHDTTSTALTFTALLGIHQDVQDKIVQEIHEIMGGKTFAELKISDFNCMKYLDRVIKESLRLYPPVAYFGRKLIENIQTDKCIIPEGSEVHVLLYDLHRDEEQFPDAERFDPDRFLPENVEKRHPYAYIPFSAGPRNCIGQKFAILEMKTLFASILLAFKLTAITKREDIIFKADLVLRSVDPIKIKFDLRHKQ